MEENEYYAQEMEIKIEDMDLVLRALMNAGYQCLVSQDGESMDIVIIKYVCPKYTGHCFREIEQ